MGEKRSNHTVYNVNYHFVWCPKYRHATLEPIEDFLEASFRDACDKYGYKILSLHISPDHVHLFVSAHPKHAPSEIVRTVKSITGREMWEQLEPFLWGRGSGRNRTTWGRQAMFRPTRLSGIPSERNTFNRAYGLHPRSQAPRRSACSACRRPLLSSPFSTFVSGAVSEPATRA
jgi:putative transposase